MALLGPALIAAAITRLTIWPYSDTPVAVDAVIVLAGGPERLATGLQLMEAGLSRTLVISSAPSEETEKYGLICGATEPFEVRCFQPDPVATRGEARAIGTLARGLGWRHIAVVTSTYHLARAETLVRQCYAGAITMIEAPYPWTRERLQVSVPRESAAIIAALTVDRAC